MVFQNFKWSIGYLLMLEMFAASYHYEWEVVSPACPTNETFAKCEGGCFEPRCSEFYHNIFVPACPTRRPGCICVEPFYRDDFNHNCVLAKDCKRYGPIAVPKNEGLADVENRKRRMKRKRKSGSDGEEDNHSMVRIHAHQSILSLILPEELFRMKKLLQSLPVKVIVRPPQDYKRSRPYIAIIIPKLNVGKKKPKGENVDMDWPEKYYRRENEFKRYNRDDREGITTLVPKYLEAYPPAYPLT